MSLKTGLICMLVIASLLTLTGCPTGDHDLPNGIRMYNYENTGIFSSNIPIAGAYDQGFAQGEGPVQGLETLSGYSDEDGILDTYGVTLGVNWNFVWNYSTVNPQCGISSDTFFIPAAGGHATGICQLIYD